MGKRHVLNKGEYFEVSFALITRLRTNLSGLRSVCRASRIGYDSG